MSDMNGWFLDLDAWQRALLENSLLEPETPEQHAARQRTPEEDRAVRQAEERRGQEPSFAILDETRHWDYDTWLAHYDTLRMIDEGSPCNEQYCGADGAGKCPGCGYDPFALD